MEGKHDEHEEGEEMEDEHDEHEEGEDMEGEHEEHEEMPQEILKNMDQDGDGFLTLAEMSPEDEEPHPSVKKAFAIGDENKDGKLSLEEIPIAMKEFDQTGDEPEGEHEE